MTIDTHTLARVGIVGCSLDVLGSLYLAYDLLGNTDRCGLSPEESPMACFSGSALASPLGRHLGSPAA